MRKALQSGLIDPIRSFEHVNKFLPTPGAKRVYLILSLVTLGLGALLGVMMSSVAIFIGSIGIASLLAVLFWISATGSYLVVGENICVVQEGVMENEPVSMQPSIVKSGTLILRPDRYEVYPQGKLKNHYYHFGAAPMIVKITPAISAGTELPKPFLINQLLFEIELEVFGTFERFLKFWYRPGGKGATSGMIRQAISDEALEIVRQSPSTYNFSPIKRGEQMANSLRNALQTKVAGYASVKSVKVSNNHATAQQRLEEDRSNQLFADLP